MHIGPSTAAGEVETYGRKARKYMRIFIIETYGGSIRPSIKW